jgi:uncharacterized membrane protein
MPVDRIGPSAKLRCWTPDVFKSTWSASLFGINNKGEIPGIYSTAASKSFSFIIKPPYRHLRKTRTQGTAITAISNSGTIVGYVIDPPGLSGTWGFVKEDRLWSLVRDPHEGSGADAITELWAVNDENIAAGYYMDGLGAEVATVLDIAKGKFHDLRPPGGAAAFATGVNDKGDVVGTMDGTSGASGFLLKHGTYTKLSDPNGTATYALAINVHGEIVGGYTDASGRLHGFLRTDSGTWQTVDDRYPARGTVLTGVNDNSNFVGYDVDQAGLQKPFICS